MAIPKSKVLQEMEESKEAQANAPMLSNVVEKRNDRLVKIRPVNCLNDFVAVLQFQIETSLALSNSENAFKNEGIVVGVGPGVSDGNGGRLKPCVDIGDTILFGGRNVIAEIESASEPYKNQKIIIISERNILCKTQVQVPFEIVKE